MFIDTHCHIHESGFYQDNREEVYTRAVDAGVKMICIGTSEQFSLEAVEFVKNHENTWATVGVHPHDSKDGWEGIEALLSHNFSKQVAIRHDVSPVDSLQSAELASLRQSSPGQELSGGSSGNANSAVEKSRNKGASGKIVGIGEIGLDYYYDNSPREVQIQAFEQQLQWAKDYDLPVSFHVRDGASGEVWRDFWPILANFPEIKGVLHSFTDTAENLQQALGKGFFVGVNGISTFAKDKKAPPAMRGGQAMWDQIPIERLLLETDAPFLTPEPFRGTINEPAFVKSVAEYHANRRGVDLEEFARVTSTNATALFHLV